MKKLNQIFILGLVIMSLVSCGKDNQSGGSSSSSSSSSVSSSAGVNVQDYDELKERYTKKSLEHGTSDGMVVYHIGPYFGGSDFYTPVNDIDFSDFFNFGYCINIGGELKGDCPDNASYTNGGQLQDIVQKGEYKVIRTGSSDSLAIDFATGVYGNGFEFERVEYDREDKIYREMLNLDNKSTYMVVISEAQVQLTNGEKIVADYVEYFYRDGSLKGFVLSNQLPLIANPIAATNQHDLVGILSVTGDDAIASVQVNIHDIQFNAYNNEYTAVTIGTRSIRL